MMQERSEAKNTPGPETSRKDEDTSEKKRLIGEKKRLIPREELLNDACGSWTETD